MATTAIAPRPETPLESEVSTTLAVEASEAYELFVEIEDVPRWLPIVQHARVVERRPDGRAARVSFVRKLERGSLGYTLTYTYALEDYMVAWQTDESSNVVMTGRARFSPLSARACLMTYRLRIELPIVDDLLTGELSGHPASVVVSEFREHLRRVC
jgi:ribosome-associated toxin RatA of RatAB toxin-antitoxin module